MDFALNHDISLSSTWITLIQGHASPQGGFPFLGCNNIFFWGVINWACHPKWWPSFGWTWKNTHKMAGYSRTGYSVYLTVKNVNVQMDQREQSLRTNWGEFMTWFCMTEKFLCRNLRVDKVTCHWLHRKGHLLATQAHRKVKVQATSSSRSQTGDGENWQKKNSGGVTNLKSLKTDEKW